MIVVLAALVGAALGALSARRRGGDRYDALQYAAAYGIAFGLLGFFVTIVILRLA